MKSRRYSAGTTLIEILVVIVVLVIGILAVIQIFPGGFRVLRDTRNVTMAQALVRAESERMKARLGQMPEMILPTVYASDFTGNVNILVDMGRTSNNIGPTADGLTSAGHFMLGGNDVGYWPYLSGTNVMRRIIGEGGPVPAPRPIGADYGGLLLLQFAPIVQVPGQPNDPRNDQLLVVYGNDMTRRWDAPFNVNFARDKFAYYVEDADQPTATIYLPQHPTKLISYRLSLSAVVTVGGQPQGRDLVDKVVQLTTTGNGYEAVQLGPLVAGMGETFEGANFDSIRCARIFDKVTTFTPGDPYEFRLLDPSIGAILFNPAGHNYKIPRARGVRVPLVARVSYDVFDWRILREEFRVPDTYPYQYRVAIGVHKIPGQRQQDGLAYNGMGFLVNDGSGGSYNPDFVLVDLDTGGTFTRASYRVDKSLGIIYFKDLDAAPGVQGELVLPGTNTTVLTDIEGRAVRALYQTRDEWAVQVMKAPSQFYVTYGPPGVAQYFVGRSDVNGALGRPDRIYFPLIDQGKKVSIGELWYRDAGGAQHQILDVDAVIRPADPNDSLQSPYVQITDFDPNAVSLDLSVPNQTQTNLGGRGYAVRNVKGASLTVRALQNPAFFTMNASNQENLESFDKWMRTWKKVSTETYLQRGDE
jgi:type II secretory pathway pseudopilin PulG